MKSIYPKCYINITSIKSKHFSLLFAITLLLLSQSLYSQCKLVKSSDEYSSSLTVNSKDVILASVFPLVGSKKPWEITMQFELNDSIISIILTHASRSISVDFQSIYFKFDDSTIMKLEIPSGSGDYDTGFGYKFTSTYFTITKDELTEFSQKGISKIQATFTRFPEYPYVDQELKKKNSEKILTDAKCILEEYISFTDAQKKIKIDRIGYLNDKCSYLNDKIDDFTKKRTVMSQPSYVFEVKTEPLVQFL